jgi:hypothetical protein
MANTNNWYLVLMKQRANEDKINKEFYQLFIAYILSSNESSILDMTTNVMLRYIPLLHKSLSANCLIPTSSDTIRLAYINYINAGPDSSDEIPPPLFAQSPGFPFCSWSDELFFEATDHLKGAKVSLNDPAVFSELVHTVISLYISSRIQNIWYADDPVSATVQGVTHNRIYSISELENNKNINTNPISCINSQIDQEYTMLFSKLVRKREWAHIFTLMKDVPNRDTPHLFDVDSYVKGVEYI